MDWGDCHNLYNVRQFLGTCETFRMFIKDYAQVSKPINNLTKDEMRPCLNGKTNRKSHEKNEEMLG